jgi:hypothetical protein
MASVTSAASALADEYDKHRKKGEAPDFAVCVFPIIVVEGPLFQSFYDPDSAEMKIEAASHIRCHWKGSPGWQWHATVDIVTLDGLPEHLRELGPSVDALLGSMMTRLKGLREAFENRSLAGLDINHGSRGMIGLHPLLAEILAPAG